MEKVVITGGTGLIGNRLSWHLEKKGYLVVHLARSIPQTAKYPTYQWNPARQEIDEIALKGASFIIHLAGANIGEKRWSAARKKEILQSRVQSTQLLKDTLSGQNIRLKKFISASGAGIYGYSNTRIFSEKDGPGDAFPAQVAKDWETATEALKPFCEGLIKFRFGVVLSTQGGAFPKIIQPIKMGVGAAVGSGIQLIPWIHIDDLCRAILWSIEQNQIEGTYNLAAPEAISNGEATQIIGKLLKRRIWPLHVPEFLIRLLFGEMADLVLKGTAVSSEKIQETGFKFIFPKFERALSDVMVRKI